MQESLATTPAASALLGSIEAGVTGSLTVDAPGGPVSVWVLHGDLLAATRGDDERRCVDLLRRRGALAEDAAWEAEAAVRGGTPLLEALAGTTSMVDVERVFRDRRDENLARFVASPAIPRAGVAPAPARVVLATQAAETVLEAAACARRAAELPDDLRVVRGRAEPTTQAQRTVHVALGADPVTVGELVATLPIEPTAARCTLAELLRDGVAAAHSSYDDQLEDDDTDSVPSPSRKKLSLAQWRDLNDKHVAEDELEFFTDHDHVRGLPEDGAFSSVPSRVDRPAEAPTPVPATFSAPPLGEDEATAKIDVASEVLVAVRAALDTARGSAAGLPVVQLLVEAPPGRFSALFASVRLRADGSVPARDVVRNLRSRPATEHRNLLRDGLLDLIERALSMAADELSDEAVDELLAQVAGYNQRIGL